MRLLFDLRNGLVSMGLRDADSWLLRRRFSAPPGRTPDEYALLFSVACAALHERVMAEPLSAWISSVVPALTPVIAEALRTAFGVEPSVVGPGIKTGIKLRTEYPTEVGSDLVCLAVGARQRESGSCIVVDSGAALTFSALNRQGEFVGAVIAPGIEGAAGALHTSTAQLPLVSLHSPERVIGRSTVKAIQSGIMVGYHGLVMHILQLMMTELEPGGDAVGVLGSGDDAGRTILARCGVERFIPELALEGLWAIASLNSAPRIS